MATPDIQHLEDALLQGRKLLIQLEFVTDLEGEPMIDASLAEAGRDQGGYIGCASVQEALERVNQIVGGKA